MCFCVVGKKNFSNCFTDPCAGTSKIIKLPSPKDKKNLEFFFSNSLLLISACFVLFGYMRKSHGRITYHLSDSTMLLILISFYFILLFSKDQKFWMPAD